MLQQMSLMRSYLQSKLSQRGAVFVEYALILAFAAAIGILVFSDSGSLGQGIQGVVTKVTNAMNGQAGS